MRRKGLLPSQIDFTKLSFSDIVHDGKYSYVNITYNNGPFVVNTPIFREIEVDGKCSVKVECKEFIDFIKRLEVYLIETGGANSHKWFDASTNNWTYRSVLKSIDEDKYMQFKILDMTTTKNRIVQSYDKLREGELQMSSTKNFNKDYPTRFIFNFDMLYFKRNVMQVNIKPVYVEQLILEDYGFSDDDNDTLTSIKEADSDDE